MDRIDFRSLCRPVVWLLRFRHRRGYGVHSPFAFRLITEVFYEKGEFYAYAPLAAARQGVVCGQSERLDRLMLRVVNEVRPRRVALWGERVGMTRRYVEAGCRTAQVEEVGNGLLPTRNYDFLYARRPADCLSLFAEFAGQAPARALYVVEGIHRSRRAAAQWRAVTHHPCATVTFDLYDVGLAFIHPKLNPQNYIVNF